MKTLGAQISNINVKHLVAGVVNFSCEGPGSKYLTLCGYPASMQEGSSSHKSYVNEQV